MILSTLGLYYEGITSVIYNYVSHIDSNQFDIDFIAYKDIDLELKRNFERYGSVLFVSDRKRNVFSYIKELIKILLSNYDVVYIHGNSATMAIETVLSKLFKVSKTIVHCHSTTCNHKIINKFLIPIMKKTADVFIACSKNSGEWLYGKDKYVVLNNAIDLEKYRYNDDVRKKYRSDLGIGEEFVFGHIGHFNPIKNHTFIIDVFANIHNKYPKSKLLLVSDGPLLGDIKKKVQELGIDDAVLFLGRRKDVNKIYQAMDMFLFPSLMEGLGLVLVEAQASGLPCIVSDTVPSVAVVSKYVNFFELDDKSKWIDEMDRSIKGKVESRKNNSENNILELQKIGFDIKVEAKNLKRYFE